MKQEEFVKTLIPIVAVLVIAESVVLVGGVMRRRTVGTTDNSVQTEEVKSQSLATISLETGKISAEVGEKLPVTIKMRPSTMVSADAVEVYVKFDPVMVDVATLTGGESMPSPSSARVSREKGLVVMTYLIDEQDGYRFDADQDVVLGSFVVTPKKSGVANLEVATGDDTDSSGTMLVEAGTSNVVPIEVRGLAVNIN